METEQSKSEQQSAAPVEGGGLAAPTLLAVFLEYEVGIESECAAMAKKPETYHPDDRIGLPYQLDCIRELRRDTMKKQPSTSLTWESYAMAWKASLEEERADTRAMLERIGSALLKGDDASAISIVQRRLAANTKADRREASGLANG